jgi:hypothetical protein
MPLAGSGVACRIGFSGGGAGLRSHGQYDLGISVTSGTGALWLSTLLKTGLSGQYVRCSPAGYILAGAGCLTRQIFLIRC